MCQNGNQNGDAYPLYIAQQTQKQGLWSPRVMCGLPCPSLKGYQASCILAVVTPLLGATSDRFPYRWPPNKSMSVRPASLLGDEQIVREFTEPRGNGNDDLTFCGSFLDRHNILCKRTRR